MVFTKTSKIKKTLREYWTTARKIFATNFCVPSELQFRDIASRFKQLHGISYIIRATYESRIYVLALVARPGIHGTQVFSSV